MAGASIETIRANPENALLKLQVRMRLRWPIQPLRCGRYPVSSPDDLDSRHSLLSHPCAQEKLRLDFDDGQAVEWMQALINESATAMMPQIMETTHRWAQYWR